MVEQITVGVPFGTAAPSPVAAPFASTPGFAQRLIQVTIDLAQGSGTSQPQTVGNFGAGSVTVGGSVATQLRTHVQIQNSGSPTNNNAQVDIYGLDLSLMRQLSTLGMILNSIPRNTISISAGDEDSGLTQVYSGTIMNAYADFNAAPNVPMHMECQFGANLNVNNVAPTSLQGSTSVEQTMQGFASKMGLSFENNGVSTMLPPSYFPGSIMTQMRACAEAANITAEICDGGTTLAIMPKFGFRQNSGIVTVAPPPSGRMIGYPSFTQNGIKVDTIFDPNIKFFGQVSVQSSILATQTWIVHKLDLALDSLVPHGEWRSIIYGYSPNAPEPIITPS